MKFIFKLTTLIITTFLFFSCEQDIISPNNISFEEQIKSTDNLPVMWKDFAIKISKNNNFLTAYNNNESNLDLKKALMEDLGIESEEKLLIYENKMNSEIKQYKEQLEFLIDFSESNDRSYKGPIEDCGNACVATYVFDVATCSLAGLAGPVGVVAGAICIGAAINKGNACINACGGGVA